MKNKLGIITVVLFLVQLLIIFFSWIITAAMPELSMHSLLSSEGIRWSFGSFARNQYANVLIWNILIAMALGILYKSGLYAALKQLLRVVFTREILHFHYQQKVGLIVVMAEMIAFFIIMASLSLIPHAILLSVIGELFPSSFALSIIPSISFFIIIASISYGYITQSIRSFEIMYEFLVSGIKVLAYFFPLCFMVNQLIASIIFIFK